MKQFCGILSLMLVSLGNQTLGFATGPESEPKVEIARTVENDYLSIEVDEQLAGKQVTVSVFSSLGEIVLEETLGLGLNKINVQSLKQGEYMVVVRENGEYASKQALVVA
ncbi:MAG: hypothetical protein RL266_2668 [Bacteroidota bacterium]|jgi:hypothetical protein